MDENRTHDVPFSELDIEKWSVASSDCLPRLLVYLYTKNPLSGKRANFQRHLKNAKKLCKENYLKDVDYHAVSENSDICYIKANCKPSMNNTIQVWNAGKLSSMYSLHVCLTKNWVHYIQETGPVENWKIKDDDFPSGHEISLLNIPNVQKWLPFGKMHERLVIVEFKTGALIRIFINLKVIYDV